VLTTALCGKIDAVCRDERPALSELSGVLCLLCPWIHTLTLTGSWAHHRAPQHPQCQTTTPTTQFQSINPRCRNLQHRMVPLLAQGCRQNRATTSTCACSRNAIRPSHPSLTSFRMCACTSMGVGNGTALDVRGACCFLKGRSCVGY